VLLVSSCELLGLDWINGSMHEIADAILDPDDRWRDVARGNVLGMLWTALLIGAGCVVIIGLAGRAKRDDCLMRGAALCGDGRPMAERRSQSPTLASEQKVGVAAYLKGSRDWSDLR
jgi:hypothetical protein